MKTRKLTVPTCLISGTFDEIRSEDLAIFGAIVGKPLVSDNCTDAIACALTLLVVFVHDAIRVPRYLVNWRGDYIPLESSLFSQGALTTETNGTPQLGGGKYYVHCC
jgi:hypothetical protein